MKVFQFIRGYQVIIWWWCVWPTFSFVRLDPAKTALAYIYEWRLMLGVLEIRKWSRLEERG